MIISSEVIASQKVSNFQTVPIWLHYTVRFLECFYAMPTFFLREKKNPTEDSVNYLEFYSILDDNHIYKPNKKILNGEEKVVPYWLKYLYSDSVCIIMYYVPNKIWTFLLSPKSVTVRDKDQKVTKKRSKDDQKVLPFLIFTGRCCFLF